MAALEARVAAWGVMKLVQEGRLDLGRPVGDYLTRWQLPDSGYDNRKVTVRRLLSHTAGASPMAWDSTTMGRTRRCRTSWRRSSSPGEPFDAYMEQAVFRPLGMGRSSYRHLATLDNAAGSYHQDGRPAPVYRYASRAATGLVTSSRDLARFAMAQLPAAADRPLTQVIIDRMRVPEAFVFGQPFWGLGTVPYAPTASGDVVSGHDGINEPAISASVRVNPDSGDAIVVLATGSGSLAPTLGFHGVFWQTGLPDPFSVSRTKSLG